MFGMIGIVVTFAMVFGGYVLAGGHLEVIMHSLPHEMMMIGGAAVGSFLLSNETATIKHALAGLGRSLKGPKWHETDLQDVLCLLFQLLRIARANPVEPGRPYRGAGKLAYFPSLSQDPEGRAGGGLDHRHAALGQSEL